MQKANQISQHLSACHTSEAPHLSVSPATGPPVPEPMQVDSTRLSCEERVCQLAAGLCLYCATTDHYLGTCPIRPPHPAVSTIQSEPVISMLSVKLFSPFHYSLHPCLLGQLHLEGSADICLAAVVNLVLLKCRKLRREDQETSDWIVSRILLLRTQACWYL